MNGRIGLAEALLGLEGFRVLAVVESPDELVVRVETTATVAWCTACGVRAEPQDPTGSADTRLSTTRSSTNTTGPPAVDVSRRSRSAARQPRRCHQPPGPTVAQQPDPLSPSNRTRVREVSPTYRSRSVKHEQEPHRADFSVHHIFTTSEDQTGFVTVTRGASDNARDLRLCANVLVTELCGMTFAT